MGIELLEMHYHVYIGILCIAGGGIRMDFLEPHLIIYRDHPVRVCKQYDTIWQMLYSRLVGTSYFPWL